MLERKRRQEQQSRQSESTMGYMWRLMGGSSDSDAAAAAVVSEEAAALEALLSTLFLEVHDLRAERQREAQSRTLKGRYFHIVGHFLSLYCLYKIVMSTVNILLNRVGKLDPVSRFVQIAVSGLGFQFDVKLWSQYISFMLVGALICMSVRGLLLNLIKFFHFFASSASSSIILLFLAQLMVWKLQFAKQNRQQNAR